ISRHHATISFEAGQFFIADEGSSNGTMVDGQPLTPKIRVLLPNGAEITLGQNTKLRFEVNEEDNATQIFDIHKR
ncbi:MAG: FHA domain-containing protein, partial [Anaerolineae bacterium]|nr:FHA domain-containing protein [Anaerolineae bacterium]